MEFKFIEIGRLERKEVHQPLHLSIGHWQSGKRKYQDLRNMDRDGFCGLSDSSDVSDNR